MKDRLDILEKMIDKRKRDEVWNNHKPYMETGNEIKETAEDLLPLCKKCSEFLGLGKHNFQECRGKPCMELWLSNEYLEWCDSWNNSGDL